MFNVTGTRLADQGDHVLFAALELGAQFQVLAFQGRAAQFHARHFAEQFQFRRLGRRARQHLLQRATLPSFHRYWNNGDRPRAFT